MQIRRHGFPGFPLVWRAHDAADVNVRIHPAIGCFGKAANIRRAAPRRVPLVAHREAVKGIYALGLAIFTRINTGIARADEQVERVFFENDQAFDIPFNTRGNGLGTRLRANVQVAIFQGDNTQVPALRNGGDIAFKNLRGREMPFGKSMRGS